MGNSSEHWNGQEYFRQDPKVQETKGKRQRDLCQHKKLLHSKQIITDKKMTASADLAVEKGKLAAVGGNVREHSSGKQSGGS